jgi:hypothetical protein
MQALYTTEIKRYESVYDINRSLELSGYKMDAFNWNIIALVCIGVIYRIIALIALICSKPDSWFHIIGGHLTNYKYYWVKFTNFIRKKP